MLEHSITHFPFRSWCVHCVKGKCKSSKHSSTGGTEDSAVPIVGFDYAFLSDREGKNDEEETDAAASNVMKVLIAHDSKSKTCAAIPVPQKGVDQEE